MNIITIAVISLTFIYLSVIGFMYLIDRRLCNIERTLFNDEAGKKNDKTD